MALSDQAGQEMSRDDTPLRMSGKEHCVGSSEIVDPSWIREVRLV